MTTNQSLGSFSQILSFLLAFRVCASFWSSLRPHSLFLLPLNPKVPLPSEIPPTQSIQVLEEQHLPVRPAGEEPGLRGVPHQGHHPDLLGNGMAAEDLDGHDQRVLHQVAVVWGCRVAVISWGVRRCVIYIYIYIYTRQRMPTYQTYS